MEQKPLMKKEDSEWIANNMLFNYCLWDDQAIMIESFIKNLNIPLQFDVEHFHFCITGLDNRFNHHTNPEILNHSIHKVNRQYEQIQHILSKNNYKGNYFLIKVDNSKKTAVIFSSKADPKCSPEEIAIEIDSINQETRSRYPRYVVTSLVCDYHGYNGLHQAYEEARRLNNLSFFCSFDEIITDELIQELSLDCGLSAIDENARKLRNLMCTASLHEIHAQIDILFLNLIANSYNYSYFSTAFSLCELIINSFVKVYELDEMRFRLKKLTKYNTLEEYVQELKQMVNELHHTLQGCVLYSSRILTAIVFIKDNYRKDISLKSIAEYLSINPTSLSSEFNKEVGCSISDYISICRVQAACELLERSKLSIAEIAEKVGFTNAKYFSQIFRELKQSGPLQYRKKHNIE